MREINRRTFLKKAGASAILAGLSTNYSCTEVQIKNKLPRWRGFNLMDFYTSRKWKPGMPGASKEKDFKWMSDWGFDFVRIPLQYPSYIHYSAKSGRDITPEETIAFNEEVIDEIEKLVYLANKYNLHVNLNLHRAPGFCINAGFTEPFNLWKDDHAQQAFYAHWSMWAKRFKNISPKRLSFDLLNEPCYREDMNDQFSLRTPLPGQLYRKIVKGCINVIHAQTPERLIIADGNDVGSKVVPELIDLGVGQSCRGYHPHYISHYRASWVWENPDDAPIPVWPGIINGEEFNRQVLEDYYKPWIDLLKQGVGVHCGECGSHKETPHPVFLAWLNDLLSIFTEHNIGWAIWNFHGSFGLLNSGRKDVDYEDWYGQKLDRKMLTVLQKY
ncbi:MULTISPECIES: cellulase family glycosylhydrolase [unclassified Parabacteroides]|uniref:glycoside hydrolase family 5 protein n=1 Tax=unclassified Parabacteroides TaxID=2649774 RepID=UPI0024753083|nr:MULTISPECIES: cellulase family glycosylhydrolase [unclassified Parabacteroides]